MKRGLDISAQENAPRRGAYVEGRIRLRDLCLSDLLHLRPRFPRIPPLLKLRLGFLQGRHAIRARPRAIDSQRPEPAQVFGTAARLVDAANFPLASADGVVRAVLVDPGAETGRAELKGHIETLVEPVLIFESAGWLAMRLNRAA